MAITRSFSETARLANVSQPALSRTIKLLEEELGARLFDRDTRHVDLTPAGEALFPVVVRLLEDFDGAFSELTQTLSGQRGRVVLGALPSVAASILPSLLVRFHEDFPQVEVVLQDSLAGAIYRQLRDREVDIAILPPPEAHETDFDFEPLLADPCALVCRRKKDDEPALPAEWTTFTDHRFIAMAKPSSVRELTDAAFIRADIAVRPLYECTQLATVGAMIAAGLGISALPLSTRSMLSAYDLDWLPLDDPRAERTVGIAYLANRSLSPAAEKMRDALRALKGQIG
ncbi:MAG: LysR family transcriptional regulator [Sphingobium sp.]|nr:LysR family transcriptional regulator [Sphingobium sp.]